VAVVNTPALAESGALLVDALHAATPAALGVGDPGSSRLVYGMVIGLVVVGLAFVGLGVWLIRQTRYDPEMLAPLERMGDRDWRRSDPATQYRLLDEVRPGDAEPLATYRPQPHLDADFDAPHPPESLDDLGPGIPGEGNETPAGLPAPTCIVDADADADADAADDATAADADAADASAADADAADDES